jgi:hypothetical protein
MEFEDVMSMVAGQQYWRSMTRSIKIAEQSISARAVT